MGYSISVSLRADAPMECIESILRSSKHLNKNHSIRVSQISSQHAYAFHHEKGLYISFSTLSMTESCFVFSFMKTIASLYGERIFSPKHQKAYPFYYSDDEMTVLVPESEYLANPAEFGDYQSDNGIIVSADYVDERLEELDKIINEANKKNMEYKDDITNNIKYFKFDYMNSKPYKIKYALPNFLVDLFINDNKIFKEIFGEMKKMEIEYQGK